MEAPQVVLLVFFMIFFVFSPNTQEPTPAQRREFDYQISAEQRALDVISNSSYGGLSASENRWLNLTGLRQDDGFAWDLLPIVKETVKEQVLDTIRAAGIEPGVSAQSRNVSLLLHADSIGFYQNVTGIVEGEWIREHISGTSERTVNLTHLVPGNGYVTSEFSRNITGNEGKVGFHLSEKKGHSSESASGSMREVKADMTIKTDSSPGSGWELTLYGIHHPKSGSVILTTSSEKFSGIFALPHFALDEWEFDLSRKLLNQSLSETITKQETDLNSASFFPWSSSPNSAGEALFPTPNCEYIVYLQQRHVQLYGDSGGDPKPAHLIQALEDELRYPMGAPIQEAPPIVMSATIFSPDCGFIVQSKGPPAYAAEEGYHLSGPKLESYLRLARRTVLAFFILLALQVTLLKRQMSDASTPSTRSRISFQTIAMLSMGDGFTFACLFAFSMSSDTAFLILISVTFMAFFGVALLARFLIEIWMIQSPERRERERQAAANRPTTTSNTTTAPRRPPPLPVPPTDASSTLPLPVTAPRNTDTGATPIILPPDQDLDATALADEALARTLPTTAPTGAVTARTERQEFLEMYARFYFFLFAIIFLSLWAFSWPPLLRSIYINTLAFSYMSLWAPQFYRNAMRNCRQALRWEFVLGQSVLRLTPFVYCYMVKENILFVEPDVNAGLALVGWVWIQVVALLSQEMLGPRFFVPKGWAPPAYDYHPILRDDDLEAGDTLPVRSIRSSTNNSNSNNTPSSPTTTTTTRSKDKQTFDCAICQQDVEVPIVSSSASGGSDSITTNILGRRSYMVTPCRHIFHSACLEGWMRLRLQCPICREVLPPI